MGTLMEDLQARIESAVNSTGTFDESLQKLANLYGVAPGSNPSRIIPVAADFDASITGAPAAFNYLLNNSTKLPTLGLDFINNQTLDSRITFTRASTATYFNSAGVLTTANANVARFDYDPATLAPRGLLIEEARTNLLLNSATLSTQSVTVTATAYTLSFYGTGTVTLSGTSTAGPLVGSGAFPTRSTLTFTPTAGTLTLTVTGTVQYAQLEAGAFATSYIPTTGSSATRNADNASMTGTNFSSWFNASAGTTAIEFSRPAISSTALLYNQVIFSITSASGATIDQIGIVCGAGTPSQQRFDVIANSVSQASLSFSAGSSGTIYKNAVAYAVNDCIGVQNGTLTASDTSVTLPTVDRLCIGSNNGSAQGASYVRRITYYPRRLSNAELQAITA